MRGEICVGFGSLLSFVAVLLMIFVHVRLPVAFNFPYRYLTAPPSDQVGQINTSNVPRNVFMAELNTSGYGAAAHFVIVDTVLNLYTDNASAPLEEGAGLRQLYKFGLYSHCAYVNDTAGRCGNETIGNQFKPYDALLNDMPANWSIFSQSFIPDNTTFTNSEFLGHNSKAAYWMLLLGMLCGAAAFITGVAKHNMTFLVSTLFAMAGSLLLLIGASIWTVIVQRAAAISEHPVVSADGQRTIPLGITVSVGPGLFLTWAAFACLVVSVVPYMIRHSHAMRVTFRAPALVALALYTCGVQAIGKITRSGRYLYNADGSRFYIKGIAYQEQGAVVSSADNPFGEPSSFIDPLSLPDACKRDIPFLQQLTVNTIRVYSVNSSLNHDDCMSAFSNAGIYTIIDLSLPLNGSIDRNNPTWSTNLLDQYIATIDVFSKYDNVLAYNVGNEVVISNSTQAAPFVKAAARDIKAYLQSKGSNALVGYASIDGGQGFRVPLADYLSCDPSGSNSGATAIDLYGLNNYEWCGASSFQASYTGVESDFAQYNVVAYFSEFGCITSPPRLWTEVGALLSGNMSDAWSGGVAFSYFPASSVQGQFGMVTISDDQRTVTTSNDFNNLQQQYSSASPPNSPPQSSAGSSSYPSCSAPSTSFVASNTLPPTPNLQACDCLESALSCQFTPATSNYSVIVGELLDVGCSLLGQAGGSCSDIGGDGQAGSYGHVSGCDPSKSLLVRLQI
ncbi:hypothetical protein NP233_g13079 [Leucocoprinus birnbaumii]|uniref:1,3-beta-glucanosyltransferase n=1 Tax=Leucocoprinus birnbaumii TaxID=56174 RepID=A0AAD5YIX1_9AGAR|nr:hypothetical protein NP233_g13079 [Leucocoprinus birnbaumii]